MNFVGRQEQINHIVKVINRKLECQKNLSILAINGPGGVGKTCLFENAEKDVSYKKINATKVTINGQDGIYSIFEFANKIISKFKFEARNKYNRADVIFPETEKLITTLNEILSETRKNCPSQVEFEEIKEIINKVISIGESINDISKKSSEYLNFSELNAKIQNSYNLISKLDALNIEPPSFWNTLGIGAEEKNLRNAIRENASETLANALINDFNLLIYGYDIKDINKPSPKKISNLDYLIIHLDDFEFLSGYLCEFLVEKFLPKLAKSNFKSTVIISGRDDLTVTHPSWDQYLKIYLIEPAIDLGPLGKRDIIEIAKEAQIDHELLWNDTDGYPFFIQLWIEAHRRGGETAISLKKFYERTTKWMTINQKEWLEYCLFIDNINKSTLKQITKSDEIAKEIFNWFFNEASIRDTESKNITIRSYIKKRLKQYYKLTDPDRYNYLLEQSIKLGIGS